MTTPRPAPGTATPHTPWSAGSGVAGWTTIAGAVTTQQITDAAHRVAAAHDLIAVPHPGALRLLDGHGSEEVQVRWNLTQHPAPGVLAYHPAPAREQHQQMLISWTGTRPGEAAGRDLVAALSRHTASYTPSEIHAIIDSMPLVAHYAQPDPVLGQWAVIFRDHYLEHSAGFVLGLHRAGVPARWMMTWAKGDQTHNRDRVHATFTGYGFTSGILDNSAIDGPLAGGQPDPATTQALAQVGEFIDRAHAAGRRVVVIDDGGLLARGYGSPHSPHRVDAALELTVSGLKRIHAAGKLGIPVINMARSAVKTHLGYAEIADSCLRRLRILLPDRKIIGRAVLLFGYGTLGSRLAGLLRGLGCQVTVVDTDILALIDAAEHGYPTHRRAADALQATRPFLVIGTTGEPVLTELEYSLLPDGVFLAPFATRDFSTLATPLPDFARQVHSTQIPGLGSSHQLPTGNTAVLLGDGRSVNLFHADSIPNQGYDAYRAGTLITTRALCAQAGQLPPGVHTSFADEQIAAAGLFEAYYDRYLAPATAAPPPAAAQSRTASRPSQQATTIRACVVGYGVAGRLHAQLLAEQGIQISAIDPKHQDLPKTHRDFGRSVTGLSRTRAAEIDLWTVCCPTADHLPVLRAILERNPHARVLVEKPACQGHEVGQFVALLATHRNARVLVNDQYRHSQALPQLMRALADHEPTAALDLIGITFTKDRTHDIAQGRFIDRTYGVLGYEWLHMLAVLRQLVPSDAIERYLASDPCHSEIWATYDPRLFVSALTERTTLPAPAPHPGHPTRLELSSSILGSCHPLGTAPRHTPSWRHSIRATDDRQRHVTLHAGATRLTLHMEPVTTVGGWQLDRNQHRLTVETNGLLIRDEVIADYPLRTSLHDTTAKLLGPGPLPPPDLTPLRRVAAIAELLRTQQPTPRVQP
ncbi:MAG: Gfo/Idh/MocA family oxidoreductase [Pseudonocardiaceae bacterium]